MTEICRCSQRRKQNYTVILRLHDFFDGLAGSHAASRLFLLPGSKAFSGNPNRSGAGFRPRDPQARAVADPRTVSSHKFNLILLVSAAVF